MMDSSIGVGYGFGQLGAGGEMAEVKIRDLQMAYRAVQVGRGVSMQMPPRRICLAGGPVGLRQVDIAHDCRSGGDFQRPVSRA